MNIVIEPGATLHLYLLTWWTLDVVSAVCDTAFLANVLS